jgi:hypothetical protein
VVGAKKAPNDCYSSFSLINDALGHCDANLTASYSQLSATETSALATERVDQVSALGDTLRERESRLSPLLNTRSLAFSVIKRAIRFGLNLHRPGYDVLRSPLGFGEDIASHGLRLGYDALSINIK